MNQEILNIFLGITLLIIALCFVFITFYIIKILRTITKLSNNIEGTVENLNTLKRNFKGPLLNMIPVILATILGTVLKFKKRG